MGEGNSQVFAVRRMYVGVGVSQDLWTCSLVRFRMGEEVDIGPEKDIVDKHNIATVFLEERGRGRVLVLGTPSPK